MADRRYRLSVSVAAAVALATMLVWRMPEAALWWWRAHAGTPRMTTTVLTLSPPLRWFDDYYVVADLGDSIYAIGEPRYWQCNFSYLIAGSQRALLFDTGPGIRNIAPVVRALTALPLQVLPSHLHFDHAGNLANFNDVALPDLPVLRRRVHDGRFTAGFYQSMGFVEGFSPRAFPVARWLRPDTTIDLGGRTLTLLSVPGHTPDSVALLDERANRLFAGDFIYPSTIYAHLPGADLDAYATSARRVEKLLNAGSVVYGGHGCDPLPAVEVPQLHRADVSALAVALAAAAAAGGPRGTGWYPREFPVNERMTLLAKYPWMSR